jgi:Ca-activated chloride channel family protein
MRKLLVVVAVSASAAIASGDIDRSIIHRVVKAHFREIHACYETSLKTDPSVHGKVTVTFTIEKDGKVNVVKAEGVEDTLDRCIEGRFRTFEFPKGPSPATIVYPFLFAKG